jgi:hypothetical protein
VRVPAAAPELDSPPPELDAPLEVDEPSLGVDSPDCEPPRSLEVWLPEDASSAPPPPEPLGSAEGQSPEGVPLESEGIPPEVPPPLVPEGRPPDVPPEEPEVEPPGEPPLLPLEPPELPLCPPELPLLPPELPPAFCVAQPAARNAATATSGMIAFSFIGCSSPSLCGGEVVAPQERT